MADKKISALTSASTVGAGDYMVLVQGGQTFKIDVATFLSKFPQQPIVLDTPESPASGALSTSVNTSIVTPNGAPTLYTLAAGTHGMKKTIVCSSVTSGTARVTPTSTKGFTYVTFAAVGDTVKLENISGFWYIVSSKGITVT